MSVSGKYLTAKIGATPTVLVGNYAWSVNEDYEKLDATTAADGGANRKDFGVGEASITIKFLIDIATGKYSPLQAGTEITNLCLYRKASDTSPAYTFPIARVFRSTQGAEIRGRVEATAELENVGAYTVAEPGT